MKKILFVCTGNTCRSPMAEGIFKEKMEHAGLNNRIFAHSAGVYAVDGEKASFNAIEASRKFNVDIADHRSRLLSDEMLEENHLILTMTNAHKKEILSRYPQYADKVFTLYEYVEEDLQTDVSDPFGKSLKEYQGVASEIEQIMQKLLEKLIKIN